MLSESIIILIIATILVLAALIMLATSTDIKEALSDRLDLMEDEELQLLYQQIRREITIRKARRDYDSTNN